MLPTIWGPPAWIFLHSITFNYPKNPSIKDMNSAKNYFTNLWKVLPCEKCQRNYIIHLQKKPLTDQILGSRILLINWLIDIHNLVNEQTGKTKITYQEVYKIYDKMYNMNLINQSTEKINKPVNNDIVNGFSIVLLIMIIAVVVLHSFYRQTS